MQKIKLPNSKQIDLDDKKGDGRLTYENGVRELLISGKVAAVNFQGENLIYFFNPKNKKVCYIYVHTPLRIYDCSFVDTCKADPFWGPAGCRKDKGWYYYYEDINLKMLIKRDYRGNL